MEVDYVAYAEEKVSKAISENDIWDGPVTGPRIVSNKNIIYVASDLRNGGVYGVGKGMSEAISNLDWHLRFIDGFGSEVRQGAAIKKAISFKPDAIVLGGIDAKHHKDVLEVAKRQGIVVIGWHATELAGGNSELGLFMNVTTDPLAVAETAAMLAIVSSQGQARALIFTDPNYEIATIKANVMADTIRRCKTCEVLEVNALPLDKIAEQMPVTFDSLWKKYSEDITYILAINDLYIDFVIPSLETNLEHQSQIPQNISAGDGSRAAYKRINNNNFQLATVPEPLYLHGWQITDELNRAFNQLPPSGYSAPVHLVTPENVGALLGKHQRGVYDPNNGYRDAYLKIWKP
ncbi:substrate-binding domain-containing protein [Grimontia sp. S25]|uniref:Autoinducer 2-binding periplasmic protein LuxP n=1 Tax=Grimontia sedimenti TaxID=2711294 RepID=A0A6M1RGW3_9GAMM|nr:substrate-binding domain-containing protein [Grimontia sedimenti]NGN97531.1 substrate-binding domain-containing protein [Grimontia sedimenti]